MAKASELKVMDTETVLVYGAAKAGKTQLVGELAKQFNLIWFDLENGSSTLYKLPKECLDKIELIKIPDTSARPIAIDTMLKVFTTEGLVSICEKHGKVNCRLCAKDGLSFTDVDLSSLDKNTIVVVDSLTQLGLSAMAQITKGKPATFSPGWDEYSAQGNLLEKILSCMQQARYNLCVITHVIESKTEDNKIKLTPLCGTRNHSATVAKYFGHVCYLEVVNKQHKRGSTTTYSKQALTGSRTDIDINTKDTLATIFNGKK